MSALLLAPHADDETLFAFYTLLRHDANVFVCLDSGHERLAELEAAMRVANKGWAILDPRQPEHRPDWEAVRDGIENHAAFYDTIIAPAYMTNGHEHHNEVALIAATLGKPVTWYHTYVRGEGRTNRGQIVMGSGAEMELKRHAMDCYASQKEDPKTAPWFGAGWQIEYVEFPL